MFINHHRQDGVGQLDRESRAGGEAQDRQWGLGLSGPASQSPSSVSFGLF